MKFFYPTSKESPTMYRVCTYIDNVVQNIGPAVSREEANRTQDALSEAREVLARAGKIDGDVIRSWSNRIEPIGKEP